MTTNRRLVCREFGPPENLTFEDQPLPEPQPHEVLIKVAAAGVGFVDALLVQGKYQVQPPLPYYPGGEFAGQVVAIGADVGVVRCGPTPASRHR